MSDLIKAIPWDTLKEKAVIIIVAMILITFIVIALISIIHKITEKSIEQQTIIKEKELVKEQTLKTKNEIEVTVNESASLKDTNIANIKNSKNNKVKVDIGKNTKIQSSRIGNVDD